MQVTLVRKLFSALDADGETLASLGAPGFQNFSPALGLHLFAKAMHTEPVQALGLVNSFQGSLYFARRTASERDGPTGAPEVGARFAFPASRAISMRHEKKRAETPRGKVHYNTTRACKQIARGRRDLP